MTEDVSALELRVKRLVAQKKATEEEIDEQSTVLRAQGIGLSEPLVDSEGYPRSDVDVYTVRHTRAQIIRLRNDLGEKMVRLRS